MKRTLLNITDKMSRNIGHTNLIAKDLENSTYWIFEATKWKLQDVLREFENRILQDRIKVYINTQHISSTDYIVEMGNNGLLIKFIKDKFEYQLDGADFIEIKGDIEQYA